MTFCVGHSKYMSTINRLVSNRMMHLVAQRLRAMLLCHQLIRAIGLLCLDAPHPHPEQR
jgi:hypothetical protein